MRKLPLLFLSLLGLGVSLSSHAETRYVSDELSTYVHSGPGNQYRIVGSLNSGSTVTVLSRNAATGYVQVKDDKDRTVWLPEKPTQHTAKYAYSHPCYGKRDPNTA